MHLDALTGGPGPAGTSPEVQRLLDLVRAHVGTEAAWLTTFDDGRQVVRAASGTLGDDPSAVGDTCPLEASYCVRVIAGVLPPVVADARRHAVTREMPVTHRRGIGSYAGVPLHGPAGDDPVGMLCCLSRHADPGLAEASLQMMGLVADLLGDQLGLLAEADRAPGPGDHPPEDAGDAADRVRLLLRDREIRTVFQPVVDLACGERLGYEALTRFSRTEPGGGVADGPAEVFGAASRAGVGVELELLAARRALAHRDSVPQDRWLGVNLSAEALVVPDVIDTVMAHAGRRVGVEITEHTPVLDYPSLVAVTDELRAAGISVAVDDAGAGYAGLHHILELRPSVIKLDIGITRGVDADPVRQALARSLVRFADDIGASLIAEGIETTHERDTLQELGVRLGQGYLLARPGPLPPLP